MKWIYILRCENDNYYVGETTRLYRRFREHAGGLGGKNTSFNTPENIVALYSVDRLYKFFNYLCNVNNNEYELSRDIFFYRNGLLENFNINENTDEENDDKQDSLWVENFIAEKLMMDNRVNWKKIRGGKYTRFDVDYKFPDNKLTKEIPNCMCGLPCDIKLNEEHNYLYFRCAKKNMWNEMRDEFEITDDPCKFFMKYTKDVNFKNERMKQKQQITRLLNRSGWLKEIAGGHYEKCVGGCDKEYDENNTIRYSRKPLQKPL